MAEYVALDVSSRSTSVHIVDQQGRCLWRGTCPTDATAMVDTIRRHAPAVERVGLETGMLSTGTVKLSWKRTEKRRSLLELRTYVAASAPVTSAQIAKACARTARYSAAGR